jgi:hypothetical protein
VLNAIEHADRCRDTLTDCRQWRPTGDFVFQTTEKSRESGLKYAAQIAFFLLLLIVGAGVYRDCGISWDEPLSRLNGVVTLKYVAERFAPSLLKGRSGGSPPLDRSGPQYRSSFEKHMGPSQQKGAGIQSWE